MHMQAVRTTQLIVLYILTSLENNTNTTVPLKLKLKKKSQRDTNKTLIKLNFTLSALIKLNFTLSSYKTKFYTKLL